MTATVIPLRRKPVRLMECYRARMFRETTAQLQAEVAARRIQEEDDHFTALLAAALELELASDEALKVCARIRESF